MTKEPKMDSALHAACETREKFFGNFKLDHSNIERARDKELKLAAADRKLLPSVAEATEITLRFADIPALTALRVKPQEMRDGTIFYIHGGGWALGSHVSYEDVVRRLAIETGMTVLAVSYRLSPEHPFPAGLNDCVSAWRSLIAGSVPGCEVRSPLLIAGDSAGANLALSVIFSQIDLKVGIPDAALLFYGVYGANFNTTSYHKWAEGPGLTRSKMRNFWNWYCPKAERNNPRVQPLLASYDQIQSLPPIYLAAAEIDPLLSDSESLFRKLSLVSERDDTFVLWSGLVHGCLGFANRVPRVREEIKNVGEWVNSRFPAKFCPACLASLAEL